MGGAHSTQVVDDKLILNFSQILWRKETVWDTWP